MSRTVTPRRTYDTYNTRYTHGPTATTRRRGDARIKRCCRQRPGGVEGTRIREKAPKEGVSGRWWLRTGGRGQGECPGTERRGRVAAGGGGGKSGVGARLRTLAWEKVGGNKPELIKRLRDREAVTKKFLKD